MDFFDRKCYNLNENANVNLKRGIAVKKYQDALLELRSKLNISQEELAKMLNVSFSSVNRWENGKFEPTKIVKYRIDKILKENSIEVEEDESKK